MNLIAPKITVQNMEGNHWLCTFEHKFSEEECIALTLKAQKVGNQTLELLQKALLGRAMELLQKQMNKLG